MYKPYKKRNRLTVFFDIIVNRLSCRKSKKHHNFNISFYDKYYLWVVRKFVAFTSVFK